MRLIRNFKSILKFLEKLKWLTLNKYLTQKHLWGSKLFRLGKIYLFIERLADGIGNYQDILN